ncbi:MAG: phosphohydrolase, partial [Clostridia bacterium]
PKIICNMALEHHGKSQIQFFYLKAKNITEGEINSQAYMYDNPLPQNKIAAILMIADTVEAASRAKGLQDKTDLQNFIDSIVKHKLDTHQFDDCDITMKDLKIIKSTIVEVLPAIYHKRIDYPTEKKND